MPFSPSSRLDQRSLEVSNHTDAMLGYWDRQLICRYANQAYQKWFGKSPEQMIDKISMKELLGPLFEQNLPYINAALLGQQQIFEREILLPSGEIRVSIATYYPHNINGAINGFFVHVADITMLKNNLGEKRINSIKKVPFSGYIPEERKMQLIAETIRQYVFGKFPGITFLARQHLVSATKLKTDFKAQYNKTPFAYYRQQQMEIAEQFLADNKYSKRQVATLFNFSSTANFSICYNNHLSKRIQP